MTPGASTMPAASMVSSASPETRPIAVKRPLLAARSPSIKGLPRPSAISAFRMTRSCMRAALLQLCAFDRDRGAGLDALQRLHVVERAAPDVAGAGEADLAAVRNRRRAEPDGDRVAVGPEREFAGFYHGPRVLLARQRDRRREINLVAPGLSAARE